MRLRYWLGIDTGGTFTDFVLLDGQIPRTHKVLSTPSAPEQAILQGIHELGLDKAMAAGELAIIHGTTVATNAALEGKGGKPVFITHDGLEDLLRIGRQNRAQLYNLTPAPRTAIVDTLPTLGVSCRSDAQGHTLTPFDEQAAETLRQQVRQLNPDAVAVCLLFSWLNPSLELAVAKALAPLNIPVSSSHQILPTQGEYERGMATWLNAWLGPKVHRYLQRLQAATAPAPLAIMQSHGGTLAAEAAADQAVNLLLSGPAGGLAAARRLSQQLALPRLMTFDMGGTSTDVSLLDGDIRLTQQGHIGPYPVAVPMVDMHTIGAGGGSLARVDDGGLLHVGPESAGADPGPACYGRGGSQVTVTDANLFLGRLNPELPLAGSLQLNHQTTEQAMQTLATQLGSDPLSAAQGVIALANEHMTQALRVISIQRGFDPADFTLTSFGGAGGLHVCALADNLGMSRALVPQRAGVLSAEGLVYAPRQRELLQALPEQPDTTTLNAHYQQLAQQGRAALRAEGIADQRIEVHAYLEMCYQGQSSLLQVPWQEEQRAREEDFQQRHQQRFGHRLGLPVRTVNLRVQCRAETPSHAIADLAEGEAQPCRLLNLADQPDPVPVYLREQLGKGQQLQGPALIHETTGTTWLAQGWQCQVSPQGHLLLHRQQP